MPSCIRLRVWMFDGRLRGIIHVCMYSRVAARFPTCFGEAHPATYADAHKADVHVHPRPSTT